jgi:hypothetical protein
VCTLAAQQFSGSIGHVRSSAAQQFSPGELFPRECESRAQFSRPAALPRESCSPGSVDHVRSSAAQQLSPGRVVPRGVWITCESRAQFSRPAALPRESCSPGSVDHMCSLAAPPALPRESCSLESMNYVQIMYTVQPSGSSPQEELFPGEYRLHMHFSYLASSF